MDGCPARPADPEGWFALGDPAIPGPADPELGWTGAVGFDAEGRPFAVVVRPGDLALARVDGPRFRVETLGPMETKDVKDVAASPDGRVVAAMTGERVVVFARSGERWRRDEAANFCVGNRWNIDRRKTTILPSMTIDGAGRVWQGCLENVYGPGDSTLGIREPPIREHNLHLGRLEGTRWVAVAAGLPPIVGGQVRLTRTERGEPLIFGDRSGFVAPTDDRARSGEPRLLREYVAGDGPRLRPVLPFNCEGSIPFARASCLLPVAEEHDRWQFRSTLAHREGTWLLAAPAPFLLAIGDGTRWRAAVGPTPPGISATAEWSDVPVALAVDRCGRPTAMWRERLDEATAVLGRAWDGQTWRALPGIAGEGPHGLAAGPDGDVFVWVDRNRRIPGTVGSNDGFAVWHVRAGAASQQLPVLTPDLPGAELRRARLDHDGSTLRIYFPARTRGFNDVFVGGHRFDGAAWQVEQVPKYLSDTPPVPPGVAGWDAEHSGQAIDERGRRFVAWTDPTGLEVMSLDGPTWRALPSIATSVTGPPAIAVGGGRLCVAWSGPVGVTTEVFLRCRRLDP